MPASSADLTQEFSYVPSLFTSPSDFPLDLWEYWRSLFMDANVQLPIALKFLHQEKKSGVPVPGQLWIVVRQWVNGPIHFVLSCTTGAVGEYPIFITASPEAASMDKSRLIPYMLALVHDLYHTVPVTRVYSIFAPDNISSTFAYAWAKKTNISVYEAPYYSAVLTYCTQATLSHPQITMNSQPTMRKAEDRDIEAVAELCFGFAKESEPFILTREQALHEATVMVQSGQVWVHYISLNETDEPELACIVATTRNSDDVAFITKVYTSEKWRRRGCAERLVKIACKQLLTQYKSVALYVAHENPAARKTYDKVGFVGLKSEGEQVEGVSSWTEYGFNREHVTLGHW